MWVITGPFDGEALNEVGFQKSKVLKSGKSYRIGRKSDCDLAVNHKKVSHDHGQFIVGGFSPDDITNTGYAPTLRILNSKNKTMRIWREGFPDGVIVNPGATLELQPEDRVDIVSGLPLTVQWQRICCFETPGKVRTPIPIDGCASLGVHIVRTLHPDITHHLVPSHALTPAHVTSLLSAAQLVKPEWLSELLDLSILDPRETPRALEHTFVLPSESRFRPGFAADLPMALKTLRAWEPNETRLNMLKGYRFVFAGDKGFEVPSGYRDVVKRGGAEYEAFAVSAGVVRWRKALLRAKALAEGKNAKVVLVADGGAMELAVGAEEWDEMVSVAKNLELEFILPENILQAIAYVDMFYVDSAATSAESQKQSSGETPPPDIVPNTLEAEPSFVPPIDVRPVRRAPNPALTTSELPPPVAVPLGGKAAPESESQIANAPLPRRLPPRRAERNRTTTPSGPGDDAVVVEASQTPAPPPDASQLPTPVSQVSRLPPRRRANKGVEPSSALLSGNPEPLPSQSVQLDKYKALFDASNPDRAPSETQQTGSTPVGIGMLSAVPEEQESQSLSQSGDARGTKRSRTDDDVEMADVSTETGGNAEQTRLPKRRAVDANAVQQPVATQPKPNLTSIQTQRSGAAEAAATGIKRAGTAKPPSSAKSPTTNKLDTDENFLKAVNSTKRGKKHEDDFDREFNQLRITNPKAKKKQDKDQIEDAVVPAITGDDGAATSRPWDAIDDFGDVGLRGNFMVVVEMDIQRGSVRPTLAVRTQDAAKSEWVGRSNFKKFKKKSAMSIERRPTVELVVNEENDYGIGNAYWKSGASGSQSHSDSQDITAAHPPLPRSKSKPPSKPSRAPAATLRRRRALTIAEDDDEAFDLNIGEDQDDEMDEETPAVAPAPKTTRSKAGTRARAPAPASPAKPKKPTSKASTAAKTKAKTKAPARGKGKQPALFLSDPSDEEGGDGDMAVDDAASDGGDSALVSELVGDDRETSTLRSTAGTQIRRAAARGAKKRPATVLVDPDGDSDDDAVFKGFGGRKRGRIG